MTEIARMKANLRSHRELLDRLDDHVDEVVACGRMLFEALRKGNKILICGNGGSAADSQHFAAEVVGRFSVDRQAFPAIALTTDSSILTAVGNDFGFEFVFRRQVEGLGAKDDVLVAISTSGNSPNVLHAVRAASDGLIKTVALTGKTGGELAQQCDRALVVPSDNTQEIQIAHIWTLHQWVELIELWYDIGHVES